MTYNFKSIESKWQKKWEEKKVFRVKENQKKKKFYVLDMFPYPSGEGLHMGHAFVFSLGDIYARFKRLQGYNVIYPIGYDSLGLPAENAAIKKGIHPEEYTKKSIANFMKQQKAMGWSYDWGRMFKTSDAEFYKWDQWIFLQMLKKGLAYRKKSAVNYCEKCQTVLANEQVVNGKCWRHDDTNIKIKHLEQWFFKITNYADELLSGLDKLDWPERAKLMQRNWIGKSQGTEIDFEINKKKWPIFTTRPDTIFGVTFMVVSAQHPRLFELITKEQKKKVEDFFKVSEHSPFKQSLKQILKNISYQKEKTIFNMLKDKEEEDYIKDISNNCFPSFLLIHFPQNIIFETTSSIDQQVQIDFLKNLDETQRLNWLNKLAEAGTKKREVLEIELDSTSQNAKPMVSKIEDFYKQLKERLKDERYNTTKSEIISDWLENKV